MSLIARVAFIFVGAALMWTAPAQAKGTSYLAVGGEGDFKGYFGCPAGRVLVGLYGSVGSWLDQLGLVCAELTPPSWTRGPLLREPPRGGGGGTPVERQCPDESAIRAIEFSVLGEDEDDPLPHVRLTYVAHISFRCYRPKDGSHADNNVTAIGTPFNPARKSFPVQECSGNEYAVGLNIRYGTHVNAIGLVCADINPSAASVPGTGHVAAPHGKIGEKYAALGGLGGALGPSTGGEADAPYGGRCQAFRHGTICWHPQIGEAFTVWGAIHDKWVQLSRVEFGYPITDERTTPDGRGRYNHFRYMQYPGKPESSIYWSQQTGAFGIHGAIRDAWAQQGWERGPLGYPTSDEHQDGKFRRSNFERGHILWASDTGIQIKFVIGERPVFRLPSSPWP